MPELILAGALVALLGLVAYLVSGVSLENLLSLAGGLVAIGLALGLPTGFWYHVVLGRALRAKRRATPRWWLRPVSHHASLNRQEFRPVRNWFFAGGVGFLFTFAGCAVGLLAVLRMFWGRE